MLIYFCILVSVLVLCVYFSAYSLHPWKKIVWYPLWTWFPSSLFHFAGLQNYRWRPSLSYQLATWVTYIMYYVPCVSNEKNKQYVKHVRFEKISRNSVVVSFIRVYHCNVNKPPDRFRLSIFSIFPWFVLKKFQIHLLNCIHFPFPLSPSPFLTENSTMEKCPFANIICIDFFIQYTLV